MSYQLPIYRSRKAFICGVDPDIEKSGVAIWSRAEDCWVLLKTMPYIEMQETICRYDTELIQIVIEAGWKNKGMYKHHKDSLPKNFNTWTDEGRMGYMFQRGVDVGRNHSVGQVLSQYLTASGYQVLEWQPKTPKWSPQDLAMYTGLKIRSNPEIRDAIKLAFLNK